MPKMAVDDPGKRVLWGKTSPSPSSPTCVQNNWAAGYINVAVGDGIESLAADDNAAPAGPKGIIAGYPDGRIPPE